MRFALRGWMLLQSRWLLRLSPSRVPTTCAWCLPRGKHDPEHLMCTGVAFRLGDYWWQSCPDVPCACALRAHAPTYRGHP